MIDPSVQSELQGLLSQMSLESQHAVLEHARKVDAEPTPEERQAAWQAFLNRPRSDDFDDEFEIDVEEAGGFVPTPFWHPHESIY
jgi:hypothetical protein